MEMFEKMREPLSLLLLLLSCFSLGDPAVGQGQDPQVTTKNGWARRLNKGSISPSSAEKTPRQLTLLRASLDGRFTEKNP